MNIIPINGVLHATTLEEWPEKPAECIHTTLKAFAPCPDCMETLNCYQMELNRALTHCHPIVSEDQEYVKVMVKASNAKTWPEKFDIVDHTIYKVELEMEEVSQFRHLDPQWLDWVDTGMRLPECEYRKAYRLKGEQPKEEDLIDDFFTIVDDPTQMKTKVKINFTDNENRDFDKGEVGYVDGYVRGGNDVPLAAVVIGERIVLVPIHGLDVIKTKI